MDRKFVVDFGFVFEIEPAGRSKTDRCDGRIGAKFFFVIGMPTHFIAAIAVEIEQNAVEGGAAGKTFDACFYGE